MQFLILAYDARDADAPVRRLAARQAHLENIAAYKARGHMIVGAALLDDAGNMVGSVLMVDFPGRAECDAWLAADPYTVQNVWGEVRVQACRVAPAFAALPPGA